MCQAKHIFGGILSRMLLAVVCREDASATVVTVSSDLPVPRVLDLEQAQCIKRRNFSNVEKTSPSVLMLGASSCRD